RRQALREVRARSLHGLLRCSLAAGALDEALAHAGAAQRAYGRGHPRLPELQHDLARLLVLRGRHDRALPLLRRLLSVFTDPPRAAVTHALLAHAAAGLGEAATYERSWAEAWALLDERGAGPAAATVLLHLGKAADLAEDWLRARMVGERFASLALELRSGRNALEISRMQTPTAK
ncbi:MAG: tetratricopeptide repeat protein, partial [Thioalkalivibrio sp.]|nr:tetratricopeptide repeat protein [Thioalkalivibrio sp.]